MMQIDTFSEDAPRISILMPAYNAARFVGETLDDLLRQSFPHFELVAVEDGSADDTLAILQAYAARDPRVVVLRNDRNLGLVRSLSRGVRPCGDGC